jgi:hypothetical protein
MTPFSARPGRWVKTPPALPDQPTTVWINPPQNKSEPASQIKAKTCLKVVDIFRMLSLYQYAKSVHWDESVPDSCGGPKCLIAHSVLH